MNKKILFCDSSVNPQEKIGFGAYLLIDNINSINSIDKSEIKTKFFDNTSSTKLELQTLLWALKNIPNDITKIDIYTDCQNIITLKSRREKLQSSNYKTKTQKPIKNAELYKEFFILLDKFEINFYKVKGHKKTKIKDEIDKIFTLVDRISRKTLRTYINCK